MDSKLHGAFKEIFQKPDFLLEASNKGCSCALICNDEKWLNEGGSLGKETYVVLAVIDESGVLLSDPQKPKQYSKLLHACLNNHEYNPMTGEVIFCKPNIVLNIWQHEIKTRLKHETFTIDNYSIPLFRIIKGDAGTVVDDLKRLLHVRRNGWETYALFYGDAIAFKYGRQDGQIPSTLRLQLPDSERLKVDAIDVILIRQGPPQHIGLETSIQNAGCRKIQADFKILKNIYWYMEKHPQGAEFFRNGQYENMTLRDSLEVVFPEFTTIWVSEYSKTQFKRIRVQGTLGNVLVTLYNFFQNAKVDWRERHGDSNTHFDVIDYTKGNSGWYVDGGFMTGIEFVAGKGWMLEVD
jgi:hypothetical protein